MRAHCATDPTNGKFTKIVSIGNEKKHCKFTKKAVNGIRHIKRNHAKELAALGMTPDMYVRMIIRDYERIYLSYGDAIIMVTNVADTEADCAVVTLQYYAKQKFWLIKTAQPRGLKDLKGKQLVYMKKSRQK